MSDRPATQHLWAAEPWRLRREAEELGEEIGKADARHKDPDLFHRPTPQIDQSPNGEIAFIRRWNSHTPVVTGETGGGYFVRWRDKGTVIDPGCSFVQAFTDNTHYSLADVDLIVVTHDHIDHCHDLVTLVSLLRQYNKQRLDGGLKPKIWDLVVSHGVYDQFKSILRHPENSMFLSLCKVLPPGRVERMWKVPAPWEKALAARAPKLEQWHRAYVKYHRKRKLRDVYHYDLSCTRTQHHELLGERTGFGVTLRLLAQQSKDRVRMISFSGDTAVENEPWPVRVEELREAWKDTHLLVLHVGTMEDPAHSGNDGGFRRLDEHLGFRGVCDVLRAMAGSKKLRMVVLGEWGYECGGYLTQGRTRFCKLVQKALKEAEIECYYSLTQEGHPQGHVPIVPCDLGLRVSLPELNIWCEERGDYLAPKDIRAHEEGECIEYRPRP